MPTTQRLHALDGVRAIALLLGIVLHATLSFQAALAEQGWPIVDNNPSGTLDMTFFIIHIFRMATFFFLAGFFAHLTFHRRGARAFLTDRAKRILLPLVVFWPLCVSTLGAALVWGTYKLNDGILPTTPPPAGPEGAFPLTHLWFLYLLLWLYVLMLGIRVVIVPFDRRQALRRAVDTLIANTLNSPLASIILAVPVITNLYLIPDWVGWIGIPTPDQSLKPVQSSLLIYLYVFALGWCVERQRDVLQGLKRNWIGNLVIAILGAAACLTLLDFEFGITPMSDPMTKLLYACSYGVTVMAASFAFIGVGMQLITRESPRMRYLADASYWIYLMHLTLVMGLQALFMDVTWHWSVKFVLINVLTFVPLLLTYHWFVRTTWIGAMLNGKRLPRGQQSAVIASPAH